MIMIKHQLSKYTSMKHSLLLITFKVIRTMSDVRIKAFMLLF